MGMASRMGLNTTDSLEPLAIPEQSIAQEVMGLLCMILLTLTALVANTVVMVVILKTALLRKFIFVCHLCVVDLLSAIFLMPLGIISSSSCFNRVIYSIAECQALIFLNVCFISASILTISIISIERYYYIVHPMRQRGHQCQPLHSLLEPRGPQEGFCDHLQHRLLCPAHHHHLCCLLQCLPRGSDGIPATCIRASTGSCDETPIQLHCQPNDYHHHQEPATAQAAARTLFGKQQGHPHLGPHCGTVLVLLAALLRFPLALLCHRWHGGWWARGDGGHMDCLLLLCHQSLLLRAAEPPDPGGAGPAPAQLSQPATGPGALSFCLRGLCPGKLLAVPPESDFHIGDPRQLHQPQPQEQVGPDQDGLPHPRSSS
ncbi:uncharacterized protein LOC141749295 isoform X2 [Larus michahellis]|uniref:uncharacterized protein LOC141749295 isoform X2 n=1 Tax=Larus michahellis TaxID=119627 RepID=UPI003D9B4EB9